MSVAVKKSSRPSKTKPPRAEGNNVIDAKHEKQRLYQIIHGDAVEITKAAGELLEASQQHENFKILTLRLAHVIGQIVDWCDRTGKPLKAAFLKYSPRQVVVFFVSDASRMSMLVDEQMTDLEVELLKSSGLSVETFQIPKPSLRDFCSDGYTQIWERRD